MAKVPNAAEILPKIWTAWVGRTNVIDDRQTDRRQTDGRQHIANVNVSSRSLKTSIPGKVPWRSACGWRVKAGMAHFPLVDARVGGTKTCMIAR